jgi:hypothetical protein
MLYGTLSICNQVSNYEPEANNSPRNQIVIKVWPLLDADYDKCQVSEGFRVEKNHPFATLYKGVTS